jgi:hypothetical protein
MSEALSSKVPVADKYANLRSDLANYVDPNKDFSTQESMELMQELHGQFDRQIPLLTKDQLQSISGVALNNEGYRVVPTPLPLSPLQRSELVTPHDKTLLSPAAMRTPAPGLLHTYAENENEGVHEWARLWAGGVIFNKESTFATKKGDKVIDPAEFPLSEYGLRYKTPEGDLIRRDKYLLSLLKTNKGIAQHGLVWTFPVMDIRNVIKQDRDLSPEKMFKKVNPIVSPESRINVQLIHAIIGQPKNEDVTEMVNEAACLLNVDHKVLAIRAIIGITWAEALGGRIRQAMWSSERGILEGEAARGVSGL